MTQELIDILKIVKSKLTDESDLIWTRYDTSKQLRDELDNYIKQLKEGDSSCLEKLNMHFAPTSTFQEHSIVNGWADEYIKLSDRFDKIYEKQNNHR